jgi:hypothetical protein
VAVYTQLRALPRRVRRALQRQWKQPLAGVALWLALGQLPGQAATIPVGGACTLTAAIAAANTDTVTGGCPAGHGADTIVLPAGSLHTLTSANNRTYGATGLPVISSPITIAGQGSTIMRASGAPAFRIMAVNGTGDLTLQETTVSGGVSSFVGILSPYNRGGGVFNNGGTLTVMNSTITGNAGFGAEGGGVSNSGTLTVRNSTISGNATRGGCSYTSCPSINGGGVHNSGTATVLNSTLTGNSALGGGAEGDIGAGGGVFNGGTLTVLNSTIAGNSAYYGGGVRSSYGTVTITNSTISGNSSGYGGGVRNYRGTVTITNSTITGNAATYSGGGVANDSYSGSPGIVNLVRTLVTGNTAPTGPEIFNDVPEGSTVIAANHNLFGVNGTAGVEGFTPGATDIVPPEGVLLPDILNPTLALNGGSTQTHALVPGSPAIDAGDTVCTDANGEPLPTDQRGKPRIVDGNGDGTPACDIGAFEFFPFVNELVTLAGDVDTTFDPTPVAGGPAGTFTITAMFINTSDTPLRFPFFGVSELSGGNVVLNADGTPGGVAFWGRFF